MWYFLSKYIFYHCLCTEVKSVFPQLVCSVLEKKKKKPVKTTRDCVQLLILHMRGENKSDSRIRDIFWSIENQGVCIALWAIETIVIVMSWTAE